MEGTGIAGRYGGLPDEYAGKGAKVALVPVPFDLTTTYVKGSDKGPDALIEASRNMELYDIETGFEVFTVGIRTEPPVKARTSQEMVDTTYARVAALLKEGAFVVTLGGEHAISQAPIRAHAEKYPGMSVLQLDAHADLQPAYEGDPLSHASVMSRVKEIPSLGPVVAVGIRSMSVEEVPFVDKKNTFFAHEIGPGDAWIDAVVDALADQVYITLDLDVFDASIMPSTGTPEPGGLDWRQVTKLLKRVAEKKKVVGCDIVELCPNPNDKSPDFLAAKLLYKILSYTFSPTHQQRGKQ